MYKKNYLIINLNTVKSGLDLYLLYNKIMSIKAYGAEKFEKNTRWYIIFSVVFASIFLLSILNQNFVGAILLFFLLGAYFYYAVTGSQVVNITIDKNSLLVGDRVFPWNILTGYAIEVDPKTQLVKNIVFVTKNSHSIHTIHDSKEQVRNFVLELNNYIPMLGDYRQGFLEKMGRRFKL